MKIFGRTACASTKIQNCHLPITGRNVTTYAVWVGLCTTRRTNFKKIFQINCASAVP